jgi:thiol-disulfide isomerase/thioredoxin
MKNILLSLLLLALFSCQEKKKENISEISIVEKENVEKRNEVVISINDSVNSFFTNLYLAEMQDKPDILLLGQEENKTSVTIPTQNTITILGGIPFVSLFYKLELERGDSLIIDIKKIDVNASNQMEYPIFTLLNSDRTWSEINFGYLLYNYNINNKAIVIDENKFENNKYNAKEIYNNAIKLLNSLKVNSSISDKFYAKTKIDQKLKYASYKVREARNKKLIIEDSDIKLNDETLFENNEYLMYLTELIHYKYFKENKRVLSSVQFDFISDNKTFLSQNTKVVVLDSYLKDIFYIEKSKFKKYLEKFNKVNLNKNLENKWIQVVAAQKLNAKKLNKTNRNVDILTNLINDNELTFEEILKSHKGKIVLVDFWASWCSPCRKEMLFLKELKSKFNETEFKVIEISIDEDYSSWVRASKQENLSNDENNYIINNWQKSSLYKNYNIKTIPRYLLFGKDGKIIDEDAPRPSESELVELIKTSI